MAAYRNRWNHVAMRSRPLNEPWDPHTGRFAPLPAVSVRRYELRNLKAFNFVIENALGGGVTLSVAQDVHGKSLSNVMLGIELPDKE